MRILCEQYQLNTDETNDLLELAEQAAAKSWWHEYGSLVNPAFDVYMGLEASARTLTIFQPSVVPGLLQTASYARSLDRVFFANESDDEIDKRVQLRVRRQGLIRRHKQPAAASVVLHESVLRTVIGTPRIMASQLRYLADLGTQENVAVRVLPFRNGLPVGMSTGPFLILDFNIDRKGSPAEPSIVYVESFTGSMFLEREYDLRRYREAHSIVESRSLDFRPSRDLLREAAKEYERAR